jgi:hypothetical protein
MMAAFTAPQLKRLAQIMELATRSSFDPERLTALNLAQQLLDAVGLSWSDALHAEPPVPVIVQPTTQRYWRQCAEEILFEHTGALGSWEANFLQDILRRGRALSSKQEEKLRQIATKTGAPQW